MTFISPLRTTAIALLGFAAIQPVAGNDGSFSPCYGSAERCSSSTVPERLRTHDVRQRVRMSAVVAPPGSAHPLRHDLTVGTLPITPYTTGFDGNQRWRMPTDAPLSTHSWAAADVQAEAWQEQGLVGADFLLGDHLVVGAAVGNRPWHHQPMPSGDVQFAASGIRANTSGLSSDDDTLTLAPYALVHLSEHLSMDVAAGYHWAGGRTTVWGSNRVRDRDAVTSVASRRLFGAINANAFLTAGSWIVGARVGYLYADQREQKLPGAPRQPSDLVGQREDVSQGHISVDVGYGFSWFAPFARVSYLRNFALSDATTEAGIEHRQRAHGEPVALSIATGIRFFTAETLSGRFEIERDFADDNAESTSASLILHAEF